MFLLTLGMHVFIPLDEILFILCLSFMISLMFAYILFITVIFKMFFTLFFVYWTLEF